ncbi:MAG: chemotaxis protein CheW [Xenococcaceae cyanobacterium MO_207.B15]|nr:chemotaxis protein CheW [Xenococcaceae cyanobacterium MO_207.B15]MDJ0745332.1 chemotaxis protein CheW [Xenococcaceae cyanobacterium MO_167.B27]
MVTNPDLFTGNDQELSLELHTLENPEGELHLRFYLASGKELALPATGIAEVTQPTPDEIAPIPNASPLLLGTINLRGKIVWVADLGQFLGESRAVNTDRPTIPVIAIETQEQVLGLAIESIGDMDWLDLETLQATDNLPDSMAPFVLGQWQGKNTENKALYLLDSPKILRSARWAT